MTDYFTHEEMTTEAQKAKVDADLKRHKITEEEETKRQKVLEENKTARAEERAATIRGILAGLAVLLVLGGVGFLIWTWTTGPSDPEDNKQLIRERECLANGGGWIPNNMLSTTGDDGLCVYPGDKVKEDVVDDK